MSEKKSCSECPASGSCASKKLPEANNFWNTCIRKLDSLPETPCSKGIPIKNKGGRIIQEPQCPWWIDSAKHNYCFWRWSQTNSLPDGRMDYLLQNEIARLFGCSSTKIHFVIKSALKALQEGADWESLKELLRSSDYSDDLNNSASVYGIDVKEASESEE